MKSYKNPQLEAQKTQKNWKTKIGIKIKGDKQKNTKKYGRF